jgi:hypothetical protein
MLFLEGVPVGVRREDAMARIREDAPADATDALELRREDRRAGRGIDA